MEELLINGKNAFNTWGVRMGEGFLDALNSPSPVKNIIENKSRLEHGKRVVIHEPKLDERDITLCFTIQGNSSVDFQAKKKAFYDELYKVKFDVQVPSVSTEIFHLLYTGKNISYGQNPSSTFCKLSCKFNEPNPFKRA